ncbi:MAG: hypothetical protein LUE96_03380 [Lachnospiraceae bacterium]|nr:hypothetical protein [Lachnospiraceae bacterium]
MEISVKSEFSELNEMLLLERNIINSYNERLKALWAEGDMDTLGKLIMDDAYRYEFLSDGTH